MTKVTNAQLKTLMETQATTTNNNFKKAKQALNGKVDKVTGKGLSTNDFTDALQTKLNALPTNAELQSGYVAKSGSKVLSDENFTSALKTKLEGIEASADVNVIETVKVNGSALTPDANKAVNVTVPAAVSYTIAEAASATSGYLKTYVLKADGVEVSGSKIDIPKDYLVKSATMGVCATANSPIFGLAVGDPYLDFVINTKDASGTDEHIYINVAGLVDTYTAGTGIAISNNAISVNTSVIAQKSDIPTKTSDLTNDSGFLTTHQSLAGKQDVIDSSHRLSADLVDDSSATHKFVTAAQITAIGTINNKVEAQDVTDTINTILGSLSITAWDDIILS